MRLVLFFAFAVSLVFSLESSYPVKDLNLEEYKIVAREAFKAFKISGSPEPWLKCFGKFLDEINQNLREANKKIQFVDPEYILDLLTGLQRFTNFLNLAIYDSRPCVDIDNNPDIKKIRAIIDDIDWQKLLYNLVHKFPHVMQDFLYVREFWNRLDMPSYGHAMAILILDCLAL